MNEAQKRVRELVTKFNLQSQPHVRLLDMQAELGELAKDYLTLTDYGCKNFKASEDWELELGDVYFSLLCLANATSANLEEALQKVIVKYHERFDNTGTISSL